MRKILFNTFWFVPVVLFGCFGGSFSGKSDMIFIHPMRYCSTLFFSHDCIISHGVNPMRYGNISENDVKKLSHGVQELAKTKLDNRSLTILNKYGNTIQKYSNKYGVDWRLVVAVIKVESQFDHSAESYRGAKGFMQIMPATQQEIAEKIGVESEVMEDPYFHIRGGIFYLARLYKSLENENITDENRIKLTLAAYNAGLSRVYDAQKMAKYVNDDPYEWNSVKNSLSLLSKKYASLHKFVWEEKKPTSGYFKGWQETSNYVESVMELFQDYKNTFPDEA